MAAGLARLFHPDTTDEERHQILDGRTVETMCKVSLGNGRTTILEDTHAVTCFRRYFPAGAPGGNRKRALVSFIAREGGNRTYGEGDIILIK